MAGEIEGDASRVERMEFLEGALNKLRLWRETYKSAEELVGILEAIERVESALWNSGSLPPRTLDDAWKKQADLLATDVEFDGARGLDEQAVRRVIDAVAEAFRSAGYYSAWALLALGIGRYIGTVGSEGRDSAPSE